MTILDLKPFLIQFSKFILVNSNKIKRPFKIFLSIFICMHRLFLSYHLKPGKSLAFTENKYQMHKNAKL